MKHICDSCADEQGCTVPEGSIIRQHFGKCSFCKYYLMVSAVSSWTWHNAKC